MYYETGENSISRVGHFFIIYLSFSEHILVFQQFLSGVKSGEYNRQSSGENLTCSYGYM
jgi:hypothetical protein